MSAASAGVERIRESRHSCRASLGVVLVLVFVFVFGATFTACSRGESAPTEIMDGSSARRLPIDLEGASSPVVLTKVRVVEVDEVRPGSLSADCLRTQAGMVQPSLPLVERIGVASTTVTFVSASGFHGCDDSRGPREDDRRWCGTSYGRLYDGHLRDPRLDIVGCRTEDGGAMGFAWVEPNARSRYVAVEQESYTEAYETAGGLPVRIATTAVQIAGSRASFQLSEHDTSGKLLREYVLQAVPAG